MATVDCITPVKSRLHRAAGSHYLPQTPSPRTRHQQLSTPDRVPSLHASPKFAEILRKSVHKSTPKSNIASANTPRRLELGLSDWTLAGTGPNTPPKSQHRRPRNKSAVRIAYNTSDRFIPNRQASEAICNVGTGRIEFENRPKSSSRTEGSTVLSRAAGAFDIGGRGSENDPTLSLEGLSLEDNDHDSEEDNKSENSGSRASPSTVAYTNSLASACGVPLSNTRILAFKPAAPESSKPIDLRSQYARPLKPVSAQLRRRILTCPERVLDAPAIVDDYYLNLLDWSCGNQVAIGLERSVYVWSAESGEVSSLLETSPDTYISSVKWSGDGAYVSVGLGTGEVQIWDVEEGTKLRSMHGHETRVGAMGTFDFLPNRLSHLLTSFVFTAWNKHILTTGARSGQIFNHDVRIAQHKIADLASHTGEVCGLDWRSDGAQLASGGNDNLVNIWDARSLNAPKFTKTNHKAAVKAVAWCPWQLNLLATGGGSNDRQIHFWNSTTGARTNSIDTGSQVTSLRWSTHYKELASTSGFPDNSISIWSYPTMVKNIEIPAHESRVLHSSLSPDGQTLATAAADESLKFWKVFEKKPGQPAVGSAQSGSKGESKVLQRTIR